MPDRPLNEFQAQLIVNEVEGVMRNMSNTLMNRIMSSNVLIDNGLYSSLWDLYNSTRFLGHFYDHPAIKLLSAGVGGPRDQDVIGMGVAGMAKAYTMNNYVGDYPTRVVEYYNTLVRSGHKNYAKAMIDRIMAVAGSVEAQAVAVQLNKIIESVIQRDYNDPLRLQMDLGAIRYMINAVYMTLGDPKASRLFRAGLEMLGVDKKTAELMESLLRSYASIRLSHIGSQMMDYGPMIIASLQSRANEIDKILQTKYKNVVRQLAKQGVITTQQTQQNQQAQQGNNGKKTSGKKKQSNSTATVPSVVTTTPYVITNAKKGKKKNKNSTNSSGNST